MKTRSLPSGLTLLSGMTVVARAETTCSARPVVEFTFHASDVGSTAAHGAPQQLGFFQEVEFLRPPTPRAGQPVELTVIVTPEAVWLVQLLPIPRSDGQRPADEDRRQAV